VLAAWLREYAVLVRNLDLLRAVPPHQWFWDGFEHVDPAKEASAQETRLKNHTTTLAHEFAKQGLDWEGELRQRAKEIALMKELGLPMNESEAAGDPGAGTEPNADEEDGDAVPA